MPDKKERLDEGWIQKSGNNGQPVYEKPKDPRPAPPPAKDSDKKKPS